MTIAEESKILAQSIIDAIKSSKGIDFQPHFNEIASDIENYVYNGTWDHTIVVDDMNLPFIRIIEENEYDQHMDNEDCPQLDELLQVGSHYLYVY